MLIYAIPILRKPPQVKHRSTPQACRSSTAPGMHCSASDSRWQPAQNSLAPKNTGDLRDLENGCRTIECGIQNAVLNSSRKSPVPTVLNFTQNSVSA